MLTQTIILLDLFMYFFQNPQIVLVHYLNLVEENNKPITVSVYTSPGSQDDISQQLQAICKDNCNQIFYALLIIFPLLHE